MVKQICASQECTLCMACHNVCPVNAIKMAIDENGYEVITVDADKCINCGRCGAVCQKRSDVTGKQPLLVYAAQAKSKKHLKKSASGGAFQMLARIVLQKGGVCYGCAFGKAEGKFVAKHIRVEEEKQLPRILNSKYIPSKIEDSFWLAQKDLREGKLVLFSGTPCQIQGLRAFLNQNYENL